MASVNSVVTDKETAQTSYVFSKQFADTDSDGVYEYGSATTSTNAGVKAVLNGLNSLANLADGAATGTVAFAAALTAAESAHSAITTYAGEGWEIDWTDTASYTNTLSTVLNQIEEVKSVLETRSKLLSFDSSTISLREDYTSEFINTLQEGADSMTLADLNEESANLLSLETSQSLAVQAMSLANTQMQNVLRLLQ